VSPEVVRDATIVVRTALAAAFDGRPTLMSNLDPVVSPSSAPIDRPWKPVLALGALTLAVGVVLTLNLFAAAVAINLVVGVTLVVAGLERLIDNRRARNRALALIVGLIGIALGVLALLLPRVTLTVLAFTVGIGPGPRRNGRHRLRSRGAARAGRDLVARHGGVIALAWPGLTVVVLSLLFGVRTILAGVADISYALGVRRVATGRDRLRTSRREG
jgi:uncharacterized membrane protein HdeD (DUF308 family)